MINWYFVWYLSREPLVGTFVVLSAGNDSFGGAAVHSFTLRPLANVFEDCRRPFGTKYMSSAASVFNEPRLNHFT
jgi:hypothetical protein